MNSASSVVHVPKTVRVIVLAMPGVKAKAAVLPKVQLAPASIMAANYMLTVSKLMNNYPVYPEQNGEEDGPVLPYAPV